MFLKVFRHVFHHSTHFHQCKRTFQKTNFTQSVLILFWCSFTLNTIQRPTWLVPWVQVSWKKHLHIWSILPLCLLNIPNHFFLFCDNGLAWRLTLLALKSKVRVCVNHQNNSLCYFEVRLSTSHDKGNLPCSLHWVLEMLFTRCLLSMYYTQQHQIHWQLSSEAWTAFTKIIWWLVSSQFSAKNNLFLNVLFKVVQRPFSAG